MKKGEMFCEEKIDYIGFNFLSFIATDPTTTTTKSTVEGGLSNLEKSCVMFCFLHFLYYCN